MSSIVKESVNGREERIDPLHPRTSAQLGRDLAEVPPVDKSNEVGGATASAGSGTPDELEVPATAAATGLLVDGGKTQDPRASSSSSPGSSLEVDVSTSQADPKTQAMEADARAEAAKERDAQKAATAAKAADDAAVSKEKVSQVGLKEKSSAEVAAEKQESELRQKYPQIEL